MNMSHCERKMRTNIHLRTEYDSSLRVIYTSMAVYEYKSALRDVTGFHTTRHIFLVRIYIMSEHNELHGLMVYERIHSLGQKDGFHKIQGSSLLLLVQIRTESGDGDQGFIATDPPVELFYGCCLVRQHLRLHPYRCCRPLGSLRQLEGRNSLAG